LRLICSIYTIFVPERRLLPEYFGPSGVPNCRINLRWPGAVAFNLQRKPSRTQFRSRPSPGKCCICRLNLQSSIARFEVGFEKRARKGTQMPVDIVIPFYRTDLYGRCIQCIEEKTDAKQFNIILIDDSSGALGPVRAYNKGIRQSKNDLVLINDDILVTDGWLPNMQAVGTDVVLSLYHAESFYPNISCTLVKRHVIERVGLLDERWYLGFGADNDWFLRIERAGFTIGVNQRNRIYHEHRASIKKVANYAEIARAEQRMYLAVNGVDGSTPELSSGFTARPAAPAHKRLPKSPGSSCR
jgi:hypothetical protein